MSSEKIEAFWQDATADDVARVMAGETVEARFRDYDDADWTEHGRLGGFASSLTHPVSWFDMSGVRWFQCQVYREPSWFTNKPDPGPGFRLLGKFPDEELKPGDEVWDVWNDVEWAESDNANGGKPQSEEIWYRRRIEPVEPKFAVGQMVKVVGPKQIPALEWSSVGMAQYAGTTQTIDRVELLTNPPGTYYHLKGVVNWCFREDYLEAVEPEPVEAPNTYHYTNPGDVVHCPNGTVIVIGSKGFEVTQ
jgi:hypothetical protein